MPCEIFAIGDRVRHNYNHRQPLRLGTVVDIIRADFPYWVMWDNEPASPYSYKHYEISKIMLPVPVVLTDKQYELMMDVFNEFGNVVFMRFPQELLTAYYTRLYRKD